jgi:hypothetical protein
MNSSAGQSPWSSKPSVQSEVIDMLFTTKFRVAESLVVIGWRLAG